MRDDILWLNTLCSKSSGHLPVKLPDYSNRLRILVATYVTFSPDGTELLVNMGGEQVMLVRANKSCLEEVLISFFLCFNVCFSLFLGLPL